jgi:trans-aconitate methyltransferase
MDYFFFPTPQPAVRRLLSKIEIRPGDEILEPSAGEGHIADEIRLRYPANPLRVVELDPRRVQVLKLKGYHGWRADFLRYTHPADVIIGNPPFCNGFQDIDHFKHAWDILKPGGRIAMILHQYSAFERFDFGKTKAFRGFIAQHGLQKEKLPPGSFLPATPTLTCIVWGQKP